MKKVISFSLWGNIPKYTLGAVANAKLAKQFFPQWKARFYCAKSVPQSIIQALANEDAEVIEMPESGNNTSMFWRFFVFADRDVEMAIIRDTDSRLGSREAACVGDWIASGKAAHIMRDHPIHEKPIMGGMWGCKSEVLKDICSDIENFKPQDHYDNDQTFLAQFVYPKLIANGVLIHDSFFQYEKNAIQFPSKRLNFEFVGEIFSENDIREDHFTYISNIEESLLSSVKFKIKRFLKRLDFYRKYR